MKYLRRFVCFILVAMTALLFFSAPGHASAQWSGLGNSDLNILNGGIMLTDGDDLYFVQEGIFVKRGEKVFALSADDGRNLNLSGGYLYYTVGKNVCCIPQEGGARKIVHTAPDTVKQLYLAGDTLCYIAGGRAYEAPLGGAAVSISSLEDIKGLIPTEYGKLFLTGELFNYTLWAGNTAILTSLQSCYTDNGYLAVQIGNQNYMARLSELFNGFTQNKLEDFNLHGDISLMTLLAPDDENAISEYNENNELMLDFRALLEEAGLTPTIRLMSGNGRTSLAAYSPELSQGQINIVKRARQLHEIEWTPLEDRSQWGGQGVFFAETTYTGLPYGQPVNTNGYVGYGVSIAQFESAVLNNTSKFYTTYSTYNKTAPTYSTDCSGYVSYAWEIPQRKTTYSIPEVAEKVGDQSIYSIQVGDCLNKRVSHVVLISELTYDEEGNLIGLEVMEQTPVITRLTRYGEGESRSLASFQSYYLGGGYEIYRNPQRDSVTYTPSPVVPLDGEPVPGQKDRAPKSQTTPFVGGKTVALSSDVSGAVIYYTLDGSTPTSSGTQYTGPISVYDTTKLRAIAVSGLYSDSTILEYTVKVPQLSAPAFTVGSGLSSGSYLSSGSRISINSISGATIFYTTDGSEPTAYSKVYSEPISFTGDMTLKAVAVAPGYKQSLVASAEYKLGTVYAINATAGANGSISSSGETSVIQTGSKTYTITPKAGFTVSEVIVDGASVGAVNSYTFSNVSGDHSISATFKSTTSIPFGDVDSVAWYYDCVSFVYANSLFNGTSETAFSPDISMTRGMFITVLGRFAEVSSDLTGGTIGVVTGSGVNVRKGPSTDTEIAGYITNKYTVVQVLGHSDNWYQVKYGAVTGYIRGDLIKSYSGDYSDLPLDQYYSAYAQWACVTGIASGVAGNTFNANEEISREDMCLLLYNYAQVYGRKLPLGEPQANFADDSQMGSGAKPAVYALQGAGVINGIGDGLFSPKGTATRAQVAQIFYKFADAVS